MAVSKGRREPGEPGGWGEPPAVGDQKQFAQSTSSRLMNKQSPAVMNFSFQAPTRVHLAAASQQIWRGACRAGGTRIEEDTDFFSLFFKPEKEINKGLARAGAPEGLGESSCAFSVFWFQSLSLRPSHSLSGSISFFIYGAHRGEWKFSSLAIHASLRCYE